MARQETNRGDIRLRPTGVDTRQAMMTVAAQETPDWLTKPEAAARARITVRTLERWMEAGIIRYGGHPRAYRFRPEWIDECLEKVHRPDWDEE